MNPRVDFVLKLLFSFEIFPAKFVVYLIITECWSYLWAPTRIYYSIQMI